MFIEIYLLLVTIISDTKYPISRVKKFLLLDRKMTFASKFVLNWRFELADWSGSFNYRRRGFLSTHIEIISFIFYLAGRQSYPSSCTMVGLTKTPFLSPYLSLSLSLSPPLLSFFPFFSSSLYLVIVESQGCLSRNRSGSETEWTETTRLKIDFRRGDRIVAHLPRLFN